MNSQSSYPIRSWGNLVAFVVGFLGIIHFLAGPLLAWTWFPADNEIMGPLSTVPGLALLWWAIQIRERLESPA